MNEQEVAVEEAAFEQDVDQSASLDLDNREIPLHWQTVHLREVCQKTPLVNPSAHPDVSFAYVDVSSVSNETFSIVETKQILGKDAPSRARKGIVAGDVLFATVRPTLRRIAIVPPELDNQVASTGYCVVRADSVQLEPMFIYFYLLTEPVLQRVDLLQKGATYPAINDSDVLGLLIPLPPLAEQRAIAHTLRTVQEAIQTRQREANLERERKNALIQHLFTYGTRSEPTKQTELGEMPESWRVIALREVAHCLDSKRVPVNQSERNTRPGNIPYYVASGLAGWIDGYLFNEPLLLVAEDGENLVSRKLPIAYSIHGKSWVNNHAHVLRVTKADQVFIEYFFNSIDLAPYLGGATRPKLNQAQLMEILIPAPELEEQREIANILSATDAKIAALGQETTLLDELFRALLEDLMTGQISATSLMAAEVTHE